LQYLSIDVAIGCTGSSLLAVKALNIKLPVIYWFILPLCVWIIYTTDHLLDAFKLKEMATMGRHYFHYKKRKIIMVFLTIAAIISIILILKLLNTKFIIFGIITYILILIYLLLNFFKNKIFKYFPRELIITLGYMAGTWGIPIMLKLTSLTKSNFIVFLSHFMIIFSIPILYSIYEYDSDKAVGFISFATTYGLKLSIITVYFLLIISAILSTFSVLFCNSYIGFILITMALFLYMVLRFRKILKNNENYRIMSDSTSFLPFLLLL
jgi:4-hydroxybenzoate polyprenyltransferase